MILTLPDPKVSGNTRLNSTHEEPDRVWILPELFGSGMDNIHTLPGSSWVEFNRVLPETFESDRVRYPLPNEYGHP